MPTVSAHTPADRVQAFSDNAISDLLANVTLEPSQWILNWTFADLDLDGNPDGFGDGVIEPETPEGYVVFATDVGGGQNTLAAQTSDVVDIDDDFWTFNSPYEPGHAPRSTQFAARIAPPIFFQDYVQVLPSAKDGLEAGDYLVTYSLVKKVKGGKRGAKRGGNTISGYLHTNLAPTKTVEDVQTGQYITIQLPEAEEGVTHFGIWLSRPNGGKSSLRLQALVKANRGGSLYVIKSYKSRRSAPNDNEHKSGGAKRPNARKHRGHHKKGRRGKYRGYIAEIDNETGTENVPSEWSEWVELTQDDVDAGTAIEFDPEGIDYASNSGADMTYHLYIQREIDAVIEDYIYVTPDGDGGSTTLSVSFDGGMARAGGTERDTRPSISGISEEEGSTSRSGSLRKRKRSDTASTTTSSTSTSTSGSEEQRIEDPTSELELAVASGKSLPAPGTYGFCIAYYVRGEETVRSEVFYQTITSGQTVRIHFPPSINILRNSQFADLDSDGHPDGWEVLNSTGGINDGLFSIDAETGAIKLDTNGTKTGSQTTPVFAQKFDINTADRWAIGGEMTAFITSGDVRCFLEEYDANNALLATTYVKTLSVTGDVEFSMSFGPGTNHTFHANTSRGRVGINFNPSGGTRNAVVTLQELYAMPFERRVRRRSRSHHGSRKHDNSRPKAFVRWAKSADKGVELPPTKFPTSVTNAPLATLNLDSGSLDSGWTPYDDAASLGTAAVVAGAAFDTTSYGYRYTKTQSGYRSAYLERRFNIGSRKQIAEHIKVRINQRPTRGGVSLLSIKSGHGNYTTNLLSEFILYYSDLWWVTYDRYGTSYWWKKVVTGITDGTTLDLELLASGGNSSSGVAQAAIGVNGATRTFQPAITKINWTSKYTDTVAIGPSNMDDNGALYSFDFDSGVITENGDVLVSGGVSPSTEAFPRPRRPLKTPNVLQSETFETTIGANSSILRSTSDSTTDVSLQTAATLDAGGTKGLRCQDTSTSVTNTAYARWTLATARETGGARIRFKPSTMPSAGNSHVFRITNAAGQTMGAFNLDSTGALKTITGTPSGETTGVTILTGVTTSTVLTLEIVVSGGLTGSGTCAFWASVGGTGLASERSMYRFVTGIDWSTSQVKNIDAGIITATSASAAPVFYYDGLVLTDLGEVQFSEADRSGNSIYQVNYFLPPKSPLRDDLMVQNVRVAVRPNETYTFAIKCENAGVSDFSYPFFITAKDKDGNIWNLGDVYDDDDGCIGTQDWKDRRKVFTVPVNCYEININSLSMGTGEWTFQEPAFVQGDWSDQSLEVVRDVTYASAGTHHVILDTITNGELPWLTPPIDNILLEHGAVYNLPEGCTLTVDYGSSPTTHDPDEWFTAPEEVPLNRYYHYLFTMASDSTQKLTPEIPAGSPFLDFYKHFGAQQMPTLLRSDGTEFLGGVYLSGLSYPKMVASYDVRKPRGRAIRHRLHAPVGDLSACTIVAYTEEAMVEIEESFLDEDFLIEAFGRRMLVRFTEPEGTEFTVSEWVRAVDGTYYGRGEADSGQIEVVSGDPMPGIGPWSPLEEQEAVA